MTPDELYDLKNAIVQAQLKASRKAALALKDMTEANQQAWREARQALEKAQLAYSAASQAHSREIRQMEQDADDKPEYSWYGAPCDVL